MLLAVKLVFVAGSLIGLLWMLEIFHAK